MFEEPLEDKLKLFTATKTHLEWCEEAQNKEIQRNVPKDRGTLDFYGNITAVQERPTVHLNTKVGVTGGGNRAGKRAGACPNLKFGKN